MPEQDKERREFARLFKALNNSFEAAKLQGFTWKKLDYDFIKVDTGEAYTVKVISDERTYKILLQRYKKLAKGCGGCVGDDIPYDIDGYLITIDTENIDSDYINSRFVKYLKLLHTDGTKAESLAKVSDELHRTFATLMKKEQRYANLLLHDIQHGDVVPDENKTFRDYITEYLSKAKNKQVRQLVEALDVDEDKLMKDYGSWRNGSRYQRF